MRYILLNLLLVIWSFLWLHEDSVYAIEVTTDEATNITSYSATLNGTISGSEPIRFGYFRYGTASGEVSYTDSVDAEGDGQALAIIYNLPESTYYYNLYAVTKLSPEVIAGNEISFTTLAATPTATPTVTPVLQSPTVITGDATFDYSSYILTLTGTVNAHNLPTTAWFEYGTDSGAYSGTSTTQSINGTRDTSVSINVEISYLPPTESGTFYYYYRIVAENEIGISYGEEKSIGLTTPIIDCFCGVSGKVTDAVTNEGIWNAAITGDGPTSRTNRLGYYTWDTGVIPCNSGGSYALTASADGYISLTQHIDVQPCNEKTLNFELQPGSTPVLTPSEPTPTITPTPECEVKSIRVSLKRQRIKRRKSSEVTVTLAGDNCIPIDKEVTVTIGNRAEKLISISPTSVLTNEDGQARFAIMAKNKIGRARVIFVTGNQKKSIIVKITK